MILNEKTVSKEYIYNGKIINLRKDSVLLPDGRAATREVIEHPGGVGVISVDDRMNVTLVRQYRYPYSEATLEIPAGKKEPGEEPLTCGKRELKEEAGITADEFRALGEIYPTPGYTNEIIHIYLATGLHKGDNQPDEGEFVDLVTISLQELVTLVMRGDIPDAKTQIAALKAAKLLLPGSFGKY